MISNVHNMDCMLGLREIEDKFFDLAIVDPPYGIGVATKKHYGLPSQNNKATHTQREAVRIVKRSDYTPKQWDMCPPKQNYFDELFRVSQHQIIWGINHFSSRQFVDNSKNGRIKWNKCVPEGMTFSNYEYAYCSLIDDEIEFTYMWSGMMQGKSISNPTEYGNKSLNEKRIHPTQKPIKLYKWLLKNYANEGDVILDTHMGSQSSRIAAYDMGFDYWGYEIDKDYFEAGNKRFQLFKSQQKLQFA